jgi:hypothetical protein
MRTVQSTHIPSVHPAEANVGGVAPEVATGGAFRVTKDRSDSVASAVTSEYRLRVFICFGLGALPNEQCIATTKEGVP